MVTCVPFPSGRLLPKTWSLRTEPMDLRAGTETALGRVIAFFGRKEAIRAFGQAGEFQFGGAGGFRRLVGLVEFLIVY